MTRATLARVKLAFVSVVEAHTLPDSEQLKAKQGTNDWAHAGAESLATNVRVGSQFGIVQNHMCQDLRSMEMVNSTSLGIIRID